MGVVICALVHGSIADVGYASVVVTETVGVQREREYITCEPHIGDRKDIIDCNPMLWLRAVVVANTGVHWLAFIIHQDGLTRAVPGNP